MADKLRNEVQITLAGQERTMRATFSAIRNIESALKMNLVPLIERYGLGDMGVTQAATIVFYGLQGFGDTRLKSVDEVGDAIVEAGLAAVAPAIVEFLNASLSGVTVGKPEATQ